MVSGVWSLESGVWSLVSVFWSIIGITILKSYIQKRSLVSGVWCLGDSVELCFQELSPPTETTMLIGPLTPEGGNC